MQKWNNESVFLDTPSCIIVISDTPAAGKVDKINRDCQAAGHKNYNTKG